MRTVLAISYFYPPFDTTAALEASKLTCYLPEFDWSPMILASESDFAPSLPVELDGALIHRTRHLDVNSLPKKFLSRKRGTHVGYIPDDTKFSGRAARLIERAYRQTIDFPDGQVGWLPYALKEGRRLIARERPDLIFSIAGPFTSHLVATRLSRETGIPWFADFRDLWTDNHYFRRAPVLRSVERSLERRTMKPASAMSTATPAWAEHLQSTFGKPTWFIPNGFDEAELPKDVPPPKRFTLTYTGVFYRKAQNADPLLDALARLRASGAIDPSNFELRLVGRYLRTLHPDVAHRGIGGVVSFHDTVSHAEALEQHAGSSALLFFLWTRPEGRGWLSAKVYEYMASGRPILAIGPADVDAAELVRSMDAGAVAEDAGAVARVLETWMKEFHEKGRMERRVEPERLWEYTWREIGGRLAQAFDEIVVGSVIER